MDSLKEWNNAQKKIWLVIVEEYKLAERNDVKAFCIFAECFHNYYDKNKIIPSLKDILEDFKRRKDK